MQALFLLIFLPSVLSLLSSRVYKAQGKTSPLPLAPSLLGNSEATGAELSSVTLKGQRRGRRQKRKLGAGGKRNPPRQSQRIKKKELFRKHFEFVGGGIGGDDAVEDLHLIPGAHVKVSGMVAHAYNPWAGK